MGSPPTRRALAPPFASGPWHTAHFAAYTRAPSAGVPLPGGRPVPSGKMLMSHADRSVAVMGFPSFGVCPNAALENSVSVRKIRNVRSLSVNIPYLPAAFDRPARNGIIVLARESGHSRRPRRLAAGRDKLRAGRLHIPGLVPCAALKDHGTAIPTPRHAESSECLALDGTLKRGLSPGLATIGGHHDLGDAAIARIGDAGNLIESRAAQCKPGRWMRDEGFHFLDEIETICLSTRENRRIGPGFVKRHARLIGDLKPPYPFDVHVAFPAG